ncbi:hypothetical protein Btru_043200 [Bulinus truncatus]|nr:hypothetical protein Btru_043200 [Bulinus truncatus]
MTSALAATLFLVLIGVHLSWSKCQRIVCYYIKDHNYLMEPYQVNPKLCTHIVISPYSVNKHNELTTVISYVNDEVIEDLILLKAKSDFKILLAIQVDELFGSFVAMYSSDSSRKSFITKLIQQLRAKEVDGVKIDEQLHPGGNKEEFTRFIADIFKAFRKEANEKGKHRLLLSVGLPSDVSFLEEYYDIPSLAKNVDMLDVNTFYFKVPESTENPKYHSPLRTQNSSDTNTIVYVEEYVASKNISKELVNFGLSTMVFVYESENGGPYSLIKIDHYKAHCRNYNAGSKWISQQDEKGLLKQFDTRNHRYYTLFNKYQFQSFLDEEKNLIDKVVFILEHGYSGVVVKALNYDEFTNEFTEGMCMKGSFPLMKAINQYCPRY